MCCMPGLYLTIVASIAQSQGPQCEALTVLPAMFEIISNSSSVTLDLSGMSLVFRHAWHRPTRRII